MQEHPGRGWQDCTVRAADLDGEGSADLVWSCIDGGLRVYTATNDGDGRFEFNEEPWSPQVSEAWTTFDLAVGDVNGDGQQDLIYSRRVREENSTWAMLSRSGAGLSGRFEAVPTLRTTDGWDPYSLLVGDVTGDGRVDMVFSDHGNAFRSDLPIHRQDGRSPGNFSFGVLQRGPEAWRQALVAAGDTAAHLIDVNGDGRQDLVYTATADSERTLYVAPATSDDRRLFDFVIRSDQFVPFARDWSRFTTLVGDFDGDFREDIAFDDAGFSGLLYIGLGQ